MEPIVKLENIRMNYESRLIFHDLSYSFVNGIYVLKGVSGIGKTTLLNVISGYVKCLDGKVSIATGKKISYLFQEALLFHNLTVSENLYMKYHVKEQEDLLFKQRIKGITEELQISNLLDKKVALLSGGEKQRVQLAVSSLDDADILLMDEPVSNVDDENMEKILSYIKKISKNKLIVIVSHQPIPFSMEYQLLELREGKLYEVER